MRPSILISFLILCVTKSSIAQELGDFRWNNRILLICENDQIPAQSEKQIGLFEDFTQEMKERKLLILLSRGGHLLDVRHHLMAENAVLPVRKGFTGVVLIGLDGSVKWKSGFYAEPAEVFRVVDSMPMRRAEIKDKYKP